MSQDPSKLPKPAEVQSLMQAFTAGGLNSMSDMQRTVEDGPINVKLAKSLALQQANSAGAESTVSAETGAAARRAMSEANLWLDTACEMNPRRMGRGHDRRMGQIRCAGRSVDEQRPGIGDHRPAGRIVRR